MNENPLVTVNILSFNRKDELRNTLTKVYEQDYKNIEVIVVDNSSSDGSPEMVDKEFPKVQRIKLKKNIGIAGWNEGFKVAKGEYVFVLDDDSYPMNKDIIIHSLKFFSEDNKLGVLGCKVINLNTGSIQIEESKKHEAISFIGCGAFINTALFPKIGFFNEKLFLYGHENEFSMRVINTGYKIVITNQLIVLHAVSPKHRGIKKSVDHRRHYFFIRNTIITLFLHFDTPKAFIHSFRVVVSGLLWSLLNNCFLTSTKAFVEAVSIIMSHNLKKEILSKSTQNYFDNGWYAGGLWNFNLRNRWKKWIK